MFFRVICPLAGVAMGLAAQDAKPFVVEPGTHIPLSLINSVSTKNSVPGDRVYLETVFPILVEGENRDPAGELRRGNDHGCAAAGEGEGARRISPALRFADAAERDDSRFSGARERNRRRARVRSWIARKAASRAKGTNRATHGRWRRRRRQERASAH